jgi:hypothetical protein
MADSTENARRVMIGEINGAVESDDKDAERDRLEKIHGQVWNTEELGKDFTVHGFMAPFISATRKSDGVKGAMEFQHMPRFYFNFQPILGL